MAKNKKIMVSLIQMDSGSDKEKNISSAEKFLNQAVSKGSKFILFPETFNYRGDFDKLNDIAETIPGPSLSIFIEIARRHKVWILAGSLYEKIRGSKKVYNSSVLIGSDGKVKAVYRKIHLFGVLLKEKKIFESKIYLSGKEPLIVSAVGFKVGLSICYDLRFPELYRGYSASGAKVLCVPSSFTEVTGKAHWEVLLRARAVENQCFVLAPNQCGVGLSGVKTYGNSMIVDPWGKVIARASSSRQEIISAELNFTRLDKVRKNLPALKHKVI